MDNEVTDLSLKRTLTRSLRRDLESSQIRVHANSNTQLYLRGMHSMDMISVAPMIGWTDRHFRYLFRHIARRPVLYTEMVMDTAILYNTDKLDDFLGFDRSLEPPLVLQLGGNNPETLGKAVEVSEQFGQFFEINLNCGCPSNKAKRCGFGAELMLDPTLVRQITYEMKRKASSTDITVKCRIGTNKQDTWGDLLQFVHACRDSGIRKMIIHARICVLCGLSPAQNRTIPPLRYDIVSRLVEMFPDMQFVLNGGVRSFSEIDALLGFQGGDSLSVGVDVETIPVGTSPVVGSPAAVRSFPEYDLLEKLSIPLTKPSFPPTSVFSSILTASKEAFDTTPSSADVTHAHSCTASEEPHWRPVHGVMVGREVYNNPWAWADTDRYYYGQLNPSYTRGEALDRYLAYAEEVLSSGGPRCSIPYLCKPLHNYFTGCPANKLYKRKLDHLLKVHVAHADKGHRGHVVSTAAMGRTFEDLVREAMEDTIPESFLNNRSVLSSMPENAAPSDVVVEDDCCNAVDN